MAANPRRDVALLRSMRTGESYLAADSLNRTGVFSTRRKYGSLHGWSGFRSSIALAEMRAPRL
jgi:hypothetical protein